MLGKLKRTLKDKCPECKKVLQLREKQEDTFIKGFPVTTASEYIYCPSCGYEEEIKQKKRRVEENPFLKE